MTSLAPWRFEVPRQSEPVSPPPRITTRLSFRAMKVSSGMMSPCVALVLQRQKIHREMDALQFAAGNRQVARLGRAHR